MPRVTEGYREARRREILEAAARCFAEHGFHSTSMQDLFEATGLTAGLVYRYYRNKDELIAAIAADTLGQLHDEMREALRAEPSPDLEDVMAALLRIIDELDARERRTRVVVQVWGEALTNPSVAPIPAAGIARLLADLESLVRDAQASGRADPASDPAQVSRVLFSLIPGFVVQRALDPHLDRAAFEDAARDVLRGRLHRS